MTHIVRDVEKPGSKLHKKETCEVRNLQHASCHWRCNFQSERAGGRGVASLH